MACDIYCAVDVILLVIWFVSLPVCSLLLITLVKYRKTAFKTSFFKIFLSLGVADLCCMVNIYAFVKAVTWRIFNGLFLSNPVLICTASLVWTWQSWFAQLNGVLLLTVNRYVALVHPSSFEIMFTPERTNAFIAVQWISSIVMVIPRTFLRSTYKFQADNQTLTHVIDAKDIYYFQFGNIYCFVLSLIAVALYARMIHYVYGVKRQVASAASAASNQAVAPELRLAFVGMVIAVTLFFFGLYDGLIVMGLDLSHPGTKLLYFVVVDVFNEANPYTLILFCREVRVHMKLMLGGKPDVVTVKPASNRSKKTEGHAESRV